MVERGGLENRCTSCRYRGFESHPLRRASDMVGSPSTRRARSRFLNQFARAPFEVAFPPLYSLPNAA